MSDETVQRAGASGAGLQGAGAAMLGAASGGVLGLLAAGALGMIYKTDQGPPVALTGGLSIFLAAVMGMLAARQKPQQPPPAPRAVWGVMLTSGALLMTLTVFLFQTAYVQRLHAAGEQVVLPLAIWPVSRAALQLSLVCVLLGVLAALAGWAEIVTKRGQYGGKWIAISVLAGGAWAGLALICYFMGRGFTMF